MRSSRSRMAGFGLIIGGLGVVAVLSVVGLLSVSPTQLPGKVGSAAARLQTLADSMRPHEALPTPNLALVAQALPTVAAVPVQPATAPTAIAIQPTAPSTDIARTNVAETAPTQVPVATQPPPTLAPTPVPPTPRPIPPSIQLTNFVHEYQGWNNCGPATMAMALSHFGRTEDQYDIAKILKPDPNDKNVSPYELSEYARSISYGGMDRINGNLPMLKQFVASGISVIVETWYIPHPNDGMGHYRLLTGYDDIKSMFTAMDSMDGPNVTMKYDEFDDLWRVFDRQYVLVYPLDQQNVVNAILGDQADTTQMFMGSLKTSQAEAAANPKDPFPFFNEGTSLAGLHRWTEAAAAYDQARTRTLPWRMLWYQFGPFEAYINTERYDDVIALANANLKQASNLEESYYYRGLAYKAQGKLDLARSDFQTALKYNSRYGVALAALNSLKQG